MSSAFSFEKARAEMSFHFPAELGTNTGSGLNPSLQRHRLRRHHRHTDASRANWWMDRESQRSLQWHQCNNQAHGSLARKL